MTTSFLNVVNVRDYGALGDGLNDDTSAFQTAFDNAWGDQGHPQNNNILWVPAGTYLITSPLYMLNHIGVIMMGAGKRSSVLKFRPTSFGNSVAVGPNYNTITPCIHQDGTAYSIFQNFGINGPGTDITPPDASIVGIFENQTGSHGYTGTNEYRDLEFDYLSGGIVAWTDSNCENCVVRNCVFNRCASSGIRLVGFNTLNWAVFGGSFINCAQTSTMAPGSIGNSQAAISIVAGGVQSAVGVNFLTNKWDIAQSGSQQIVVDGGATTSKQFMALFGTQAVVNAFDFRPNGSSGTTFLDVTGTVLTAGCRYDPGTNDGAGIIAYVRGAACELVLDGFQTGTAGDGGAFSGTSGSKVYLRASTFSPLNPNLWTAYAGTKPQDI